MKCIFCTNPLDNSDEHIILDSLNGKLHSKELICSDCNSFFGRNLDGTAKEFLNPILLAFKLKNASGIKIENLKGERKFILQKDGTVRQDKLDIVPVKLENKTLLFISGRAEHALKYFEKQKQNLTQLGYKILSSSRQTVQRRPGPLRVKVDFQTTDEINILMNKIAFEYSHFTKIENINFGTLGKRIRSLDKTLSNVLYCNLDEEVRRFQSGEATHLLILKNVENKLIVYIEIFNVICSIVIIDDNYTGKDVEEFYYQDVISGRKHNVPPQIDIDGIIKLLEKKNTYSIKIDSLVNKLFYRKREKEFKEIFNSELSSIKNNLENELNSNKISQKEFNKKYLEQTTSFLAELAVDFPYMLEDVDDVNNDDLNYLHSNLRENQYDEFLKKYSYLVGHKLKDNDSKYYVIEDFIKYPIASQKDIVIVKVNVVLFDGVQFTYLPYAEFFDRIGIKRE